MKAVHYLAIAGIVVTIGTVSATLIHNSYSRGQEVQDVAIRKNTDTVSDIKLDVNTIQSDVRHIKEDIRESSKVQQKIVDKLDEIKTYVHELNKGD